MIDTNILNKNLIHSFLEDKSTLGLAYGKMGHCLYFYVLSRKINNPVYQHTAEKLLDEIFDNLQTISTIDIKNGLAGIGLSITYLIKKRYVKGNINNILGDIDDIIFKQLSYSKSFEKIDLLSLIHLTYYLQIRLKEQKAGSENEYLFKELIVETVNKLYQKIDITFYQESLVYNTDFPLPQLLYLFSVLYDLNFYNYRLIKIIEEISYYVLSTIPILHANRLYLLWGMDNLNKKVKNENWEKHILFLKNSININYIIHNELKDKNIFFNSGVISIYCLLKSLKSYFSDNDFTVHERKIRKKITSSSIWQLILNEKDYFDTYKGLYDGYCSIPLIF